MPRTPSLTFANVICRFGSELVLLDLAEEVVIPSFVDTSLRRKFGETVYLYLNTGWVALQPGDDRPGELCIFGQLVKDTILHSDQVLADGQLIPSSASIASAPSAFFVLLLSNHKLIYVPETPSAPSLDTFGSTMQDFLRAKHRDYINAEYTRRRSVGDPITKLALLEEIPAPKVEVLPLASRESIEQFVASIDKLTHLEFRILETNREFQMRGPYERIREDKQALGAKTSKLIYDNPEGMSKAEVANQIELSAASGNQAVVVAGTAEDGTKVRGNNERLRMQVPATDLPSDFKQKALRLLNIFRSHAESGSIALDASEGSGAKVATITQNLLGGGNDQPRI